MNVRAWLLAFACALTLIEGGHAQVVEVQAVKLTSGTTYHGQVTEGADSITIALASGGTLTVPRAQVRRITVVRGRIVEGDFWLEDVNATRLFFAPTGRTLAKGSGYLSVYELFLPFLGYGFTDRFTMAGGIIPVFGDGVPLIGYAAPKLQVVAGDGVQAAIGGLGFFTTESDESVGIVYGVASLGKSSDSAVTLGAGFGYAGSEMAETPVLLVGGEARSSRRIKVLTENWIFPGEGAVLSLGTRFIGERLSGDLGLAMPLLGGGGFLFPLVNIVWTW